ncbi:HIT-like protein [Decorospora gaudefroyi]|uniref:HIT-like protein n=1 Tax=Decorospora gaudefroyi TaxID=184978 RepID=A0A6A5K088_9PLEO|nr:HIT-like protein [Decorospora gaudefroyi]
MTSSSNGNHTLEEQQAHDAVTAEEITGAEAPNRPNSSKTAAVQKRPNAFTELMAPSKKPKPAATPAADAPGLADTAKNTITGLDRRDGLGVYIEKPETNPDGRVLEYDDDWVVITDKYPKASVHLLLLPRKPEYYNRHPLKVLSEDATFLAQVRKRVIPLRELAASELRRQYGHFSASDKPYQGALEMLMSSPDPPPPEERAALLPYGRDWTADIVTGVHTRPSMNHLHIHIFSRDMWSPCMKHKKHYLSFNTSFLVRLDEFPIKYSNRYHPGDWPSWDMECWRCGKNFKNKFAALKQHLADELEAWKQE